MLDTLKLRQDFPMLNKDNAVIYLDNGATTFKPQCVIDGVNHYYNDITANAHRGDYDLSLKVDDAYEHCRKTVASFINCDEREVVFTYGTTASLNTVACSYLRMILKKDDVILSTIAEHASCILPLFEVAKEKGAKVEFIELDAHGRITIENVKKALHERVRFIALAAITNVLGYLAPVEEICALAHENGIRVLIDGAQSTPHMKTDVRKWDCDFLAFSSHKMCGPSGIGVLYGKYELLQQMEPFLLGGGSNARFNKEGELILKEAPYKFEAGTMPIEAVLGFDQALQYLMNIGMDEIHDYELQLHDYAVKRLSELDNLQIYNADNDSGIIAFNVKNVFAQDAAGYLASRNLCLRSGNHCAKMLDNYLHVSATLRASLYFYNTKDDVDALVEALKTTTVENCIDILV